MEPVLLTIPSLDKAFEVLSKHSELGSVKHFRLQGNTSKLTIVFSNFSKTAFSLSSENHEGYPLAFQITRILSEKGWTPLDRLLKEVWLQFHRALVKVDYHKITHSGCENGARRYVSGFPSPVYNAVFDVFNQAALKQVISSQLAYFREEKIPFVWYVDKTGHDEVESALIESGFKFSGHMQGCLREIDTLSIPESDVQLTCSQITPERFKEVNALVSQTLKLNEQLTLERSLFYLRDMSLSTPSFHHFAAWKGDKIISVLTTLITKDTVMLMNGITHPDHRNQKVFKNLTYFALKQAKDKGCRFAASYFTVDSPAKELAQKQGALIHYEFKFYTPPIQ